MKPNLRVIVADDHCCVRLGVSSVLQAAPHMSIVGVAASTDELAELIDTCPCDVVVSDIGMPGIHGDSNAVSFLRRLLCEAARPRVVVLTMVGHARTLAGLVNMGVSAIVDKRDTADSLIQAIDAAAAGDVYLSRHTRIAIDEAESEAKAGVMPQPRAGVLSAREWQVFQLYVQGMTVREIAGKLNRSGKTVSTQKRCAMRKLGLATDSDLIDYARQIGLA